MYKNVLDYFAKTVDKFPNKTAVIHNNESITFRNLQKGSMGIAAYLLEKYGIDRNMPIAVFLPKSIDTVMSDLAITYLGCFFSNLDVKTPMERIGNILAVMRPKLLITNTKYICALENCGIDNLNIVNIDELRLKANDAEEKGSQILARLNLQIDTDPFCIINNVYCTNRESA